MISPWMLAALAAAQDDIRPLKPALDLPADPSPWWPWALAAVATLAFAAAVWAWWRRRRREPTPEEALWAALRQAEGAWADGDAMTGIDLAATAIRAYVQARAGVDALHRTTEEWVPELRERLPAELVDDMALTFTAWDAARFSGASPADDAIPAWVDALVAALGPGADTQVPTEPTDSKAA